MKTKKLTKRTVCLKDGRYLIYYSWAKPKTKIKPKGSVKHNMKK